MIPSRCDSISFCITCRIREWCLTGTAPARQQSRECCTTWRRPATNFIFCDCTYRRVCAHRNRIMEKCCL